MRWWARILWLPALTGACWAVAVYWHQCASWSLHRQLQQQPANQGQAGRPDGTRTVYLNASEVGGLPATGEGPPSPPPPPHRILHFLHISDIHVSQFNAHGGQEHLRSFLRQELPLIAPHLVVVTGDLTDAKDRNKWRSMQYEPEWVAYRSLLESAHLLNRSGGKFWWDQRGNHDCFNVPAFAHPVNRFAHMSASRTEGYALHYDPGGWGRYTFIGPDACPTRGIGRPSNFFGALDAGDLDWIEQHLVPQQGRPHTSNHTFVMTHYPTATLLLGQSSRGTRLWDMPFTALLCGHLHTLFWGLGERMYTRHPAFAELELGDLKNHARYRLIVVDEDVVSFRDLELGALPHIPAPVTQDIRTHPNLSVYEDAASAAEARVFLQPAAPIVLITNPKDGRFVLDAEPRHRSPLHATHIHALVWSVAPVREVRVLLDGHPYTGPHGAQVMEYAGWGQPWASYAQPSVPHTPLWRMRWEPQALGPGTHTLQVVAMDATGREASHTIPFRVDGSRLPGGFGVGSGGFLISLSFQHIFHALLAGGYVGVMLGCLLAPWLWVTWTGGRDLDLRAWRRRVTRTCHLLYTQAWGTPARRSGGGAWTWTWARVSAILRFAGASWWVRLCELAQQPRLFGVLYAHGLYVTVGPWFAGELLYGDAASAQQDAAHPVVDGARWGLFMLWGVWFPDGTGWVPTIDARFYSLWEVVAWFVPVVLWCAVLATPPARLYPPGSRRAHRPWHRRGLVRGVVAVALLYQATQCFWLAVHYGWMAVVVSPSKTWFLLWVAWVTWAWRHGPPPLRADSGTEAREEGSSSDEEDDKVEEGVVGEEGDQGASPTHKRRDSSSHGSYQRLPSATPRPRTSPVLLPSSVDDGPAPGSRHLSR